MAKVESKMAKDELLQNIERVRRRSTLQHFMRSPMGAIREKRYILYLISGGMALVAAAVALRLGVELTQVVVIAIMMVMLPSSFFQLAETTRIRRIEAEFPGLMRDLSNAMKSGMNPQAAMSICTQGNYGVLTAEIKHIYGLMSWGLSFEESLDYFVNKYPTPLIKRTVSTIVEAAQMGGELGEILSSVAVDVEETKSLEKRRNAESQPYLVVGYVGYFVFLAVILVISNQFLPMVEEAAKIVAGKPALGGIGQFAVTEKDVALYKRLFFHALLIQGFSAGLITGKIGEGSAVAGLKHSVFFMVVAFVSYAIFI